MTFPTISRAMEGFLLHKSASGRSEHTLRNYQIQLSRFMTYLEDCPINNVTPKKNEQFLQWLRKDYRYSKVGTLKVAPRPLSDKTIRNAWGALSAFWKWSSQEFEIENPFDLPSPKANHQAIYPLRMEEVELLLNACNKSKNNSIRPTSKRDRAILMVLLDTGVRVSELCSAVIGDLDFDVGRLYVLGKGKKGRFVYLGKVAKQVLWAYLAQRFPSEDPDPDCPLFADRTGFRKLTRHNVRNLLNRLGERAGVDKVHPHRFRHTFAIEFLRNGGDIFALQHLLGHSSLEMVKKYLRLAEVDLERVHRKASPADNWNL